MFVINCKNYQEASGQRIVKLIKIAEKISKKYKVKIAIAPPQHLLGAVAESSLVILAQHIDDKKVGSTTGYMVPELLKKSKVNGSIINHSEHRIPYSEIKNLVSKLGKLNMTSIVCVRDVPEVKKMAKVQPDYIAIEPPELIGSGRAVSKEQPELIRKAAAALCASKTRLLCGAGIVSGQDVQIARELGSEGILVASGIIKAKNLKGIMSEFAKAFKTA